MIEDQLMPKRCGHTRGKRVVDRGEAVQRIRAARDARDGGADILIMARTDARTTHGLDEALARARDFAEAGADLIFLEALQSEEEMAAFCRAIPGHKMANMVEGGKTPLLAPARLEELGYKLAAYPLTLLSVAVRAMQEALAHLKDGRQPDALLSFQELQDVVGFSEYYAQEARYGGGGVPELVATNGLDREAG